MKRKKLLRPLTVSEKNTSLCKPTARNSRLTEYNSPPLGKLSYISSVGMRLRELFGRGKCGMENGKCYGWLTENLRWSLV